MKKIVLIPLLFISLLCNAQKYLSYIEWQNTIGGNNNDGLYSIKQTPDGGYILGGNSKSMISTDKTENAVGGFDDLDYWIVKTDAVGNIEWQNTIGGIDNEIFSDIQLTRDGGYILGGYSESNISGDKTENSKGNYDYWVVKLDASGSVEWQKTIGGSGEDRLYSLQQTTDSGYILGGLSKSNISGDKTENKIGYADYWVIKINSTGTIEWQNTIGGSDNFIGQMLKSIQQTKDGGFFLGGSSSSNISGDKTENSYGGDDYWVIKLNNFGIIEWQKTIGGSDGDALNSIQQTDDNGYILGGSSSSNISGSKTENCQGVSDYWLVKLDSIGNIEWQNTIGGNGNDNLTEVQQTKDGGYILGGYSESQLTGDKTENRHDSYDYWVVKVDVTGNIEWQNTIGGLGDDLLNSIQQTSDQNYILGGSSQSYTTGFGDDKAEPNYGGTDYWVVKLAAKNNYNSISGKVFQSQNSNCIQESNEKGTPNVIITTTPYNLYTISDSIGRYTMPSDTDTYIVKPIYSRLLKPFNQSTACPTSGYHTVSFSQYGQDSTDITFANYEKQCPFLQVEFSQDRMRRCSDNYATIKYCNIGNVDTNNVQVIVQLPEYVTFVSASNPNYTVSGKKITFRIGALRANECGTINLVTHVDCINGITGLTQCIKAYILPRNECVKKIQTDYSLWDGSEITADGSCTGSTVRFVIKNIGQNMADSSTYRIYKNAVEALSKNFKLTAGDSLIINVTATGHTFRIEAKQAAHYPTESAPNITVENCNNTNIANRGFVNQQEQDKAEQDVEKICLEIRDSYDPNDKQIFPAGVGVDKRVRHQVPLDFLIRFQNTGTDTAYKVVITDTLNQNLDLATLEFGAASHPYRIEFTGAGKTIMKFTFDKINLVDSFTNEPKSHGFISFKITPYDSIPNGTIVKNSADIYFDFNLPIKTNTTQVSIDDRLPTGATLNLVTSVKQNNTIYEAIHVYPNPFTQTTNFEFVYNTKAMQLIVYNINGDLVANENITHQTMCQFHRNNLSNGMYFYVIQNNEGETIGRGKLVLQ